MIRKARLKQELSYVFYEPQNGNEIRDWSGGKCIPKFDENGLYILIACDTPQNIAKPGDYIIKTVKGDFFACDAIYFKENYSQVIPKINIAEFRSLGFLQEINRLFLHPLGMALQVTVENGVETLACIWDYTDDPDGMIFGYAEMSDEEKEDFATKAKYVAEFVHKKLTERKKRLGFDIEPIG